MIGADADPDRAIRPPKRCLQGTRAALAARQRGRSAGRLSSAVDPAGRAARVVLLLPDRHARFGLVDDVAARVERGAAMIGADADPHGAIADRELPHAMLAVDGRNGEPLQRLYDDARAFLLCD